MVFATVNVNDIFVLDLFDQETLEELPPFDWLPAQTARVGVAPHEHSFVAEDHGVVFAGNDFFDEFALELDFADSGGDFDGSVEPA